MFIALEDSQRVRADQAVRGGFYVCPECAEVVVYCHGEVKTGYWFSHKAASSCPSAEDDSQEHVAVQAYLEKYFLASGADCVEWEDRTLAVGRRADLLVVMDGLKFVVEVQLSPMSLEEWEARTGDYNKAGYPVLWVWGTAKHIRQRPSERYYISAVIRKNLEYAEDRVYFLDESNPALRAGYFFMKSDTLGEIVSVKAGRSPNTNTSLVYLGERRTWETVQETKMRIEAENEAQSRRNRLALEEHNRKQNEEQARRDEYIAARKATEAAEKEAREKEDTERQIAWARYHEEILRKREEELVKAQQLRETVARQQELERIRQEAEHYQRLAEAAASRKAFIEKYTNSSWAEVAERFELRASGLTFSMIDSGETVRGSVVREVTKKHKEIDTIAQGHYCTALDLWANTKFALRKMKLLRPYLDSVLSVGYKDGTIALYVLDPIVYYIFALPEVRNYLSAVVSRLAGREVCVELRVYVRPTREKVA